jgi:cysteine desulfurase
LKSWGSEILVNSPLFECSPYILNFSLNPEKFSLKSESLIINFDLNGIAVSSASACTSGVMEPSHVLKAMNLTNERAERALRFSFSKKTTFDEVQFALNILKQILIDSPKIAFTNS